MTPSAVALDIDVEPIANASTALLQKQAMRQLAVILDVETPEEAAKLIVEADFDVYTEGYVKFAEGNIIGTYPIYRATLHVKLHNTERGTYSGRLF